MTAPCPGPVAVVGMACRYPDAADPAQLWSSVLEQRQSFRRMPDERLPLADYFDRDPQAPDKTYGSMAAVLEGWEFDRAAFRIPGSVHRSADPAHWLALETASRALADAGHPSGEGLPRDRVAVVVGNSLTGEVTRASTLRLRWPYVRRTILDAAREAGLDEPATQALLAGAEARYLAAFEPVGDETLAGGLANTIAGRICNYFDFHGGGYTVDGACASSLLSVITGCRALADGSADIVVAGGVDISLDPFELVGFAKAGALATGPMRVYDENSGGFIPGEGCGMVVLMRAADARERGLPAYAELLGWGLSSDGKGGITRPERAGQVLALERAYDLAGVDPRQVGLIEGHGTGTVVGDEVELSALLDVRRGATRPAAIGSIKANIGHTKAASGIAGLIKAGMSLASGTLPPTTGCETPHRTLRGSSLRTLPEAEPWPAGPRLAGVSSMGFGGINAHLVLGAAERTTTRAVPVAPPPPDPGAATRACEPVVLAGDDVRDLRATLDRLAEVAPRLSLGELRDLACQFGRESAGRIRVGLVAETPVQLGERAALAATRLAGLQPGRLEAGPGMFLGDRVAGRVTILLPGQGAPVPARLGSLEPFLRQRLAPAPTPGEVVDTAVAQPAIHRATMAAVRWLRSLGVTPSATIGHSLGEIAGLVSAGVLSAEEADRLVVVRGQVMSRFGVGGTGMASVAADVATVERLCAQHQLTVAAYNGPESHVVAGDLPAVEALVAQAREQGLSAVPLPVSHAFHSPAMAECVNELKPSLQDIQRSAAASPAGRLLSTVLGRQLTSDDDVADLLGRQLTAPVRFWDVVRDTIPGTDLYCEAGPGTSLTALVTACCPVPTVSVDAGGSGERGPAHTAAALFASGAVATLAGAFRSRTHRPVDIWRDRVFLANPCSVAPRAGEPGPAPKPGEAATSAAASVETDILRLLAEQVELEPELIDRDARLLADLHLSSLGITQLLVAAADAAGRQRPSAPLAAGDLSVAELVAAVEALDPADESAPDAACPGVAPWIRFFAEERRRIIDRLPESPGRWAETFLADGALRSPAERVFPRAEPGTGPAAGPLVYVPDPADPSVPRTLLDAGRAAITHSTLVAVTHGPGLNGFLRSLQQEHPDVGVTVLRVPATEAGLRRAARHAVAEPGQWREYLLDDEALVEVPVPRAVEPEPGELCVGPDDVVLVSGGGKGIGYECAAALAQRTGAALALLGRASPDGDERLRANLDALRSAGVRFAYEPADVTDPAATSRAVRLLADRLGAITGLLHASGVNRPVRFADLDERQIRAHLEPKVHGLRNLLAAIEPDRLRLLVAFGSVIGRYGLAGECQYALANGALRAEVEGIAERLPGRFVTTIDWSVWEGTGMGEQLGVLDTLRMLDVQPIPLHDGVRAFLDVLTLPSPPASVAIHGRLGELGAVADARPTGHLLDRTLVSYPGIEIVAEADLTVERYPYLRDHAVDGVIVVPAVLGMELMAEAATALSGRPQRHLAELALDRPIVLSGSGERTVRVCALRDRDRVTVVLRSAETGFDADHFRAVLPLGFPPEPPERPELPASEIELRPDQLYGPVFFHGPAFQLVERFTSLGARHARVSLRERPTDGDYPIVGDALVLGDVAGNDAVVHALQACVPHRRLLPVGCERFTRVPGTHNAREVYATERHADGREYVWDVVVRDQYGKRAMTWTGLRLRDVGPIERHEPWPAALLEVYLERVALALAGQPAARTEAGRLCWHGVAVDSVDGVDGAEVDGAPDLAGVGADLSARLGERAPVTAARLRAAHEALAPHGESGRLALEGVYDGGWAVLRAGQQRVATTVLAVAGQRQEVAAAVALGTGR